MFFGGTNFGFTAGANVDGPGDYKADITSYDYDAPMSECGDPTEKYKALRDVIKEFLTLPNIPVPEKTKTIKLESVKLSFQATILSDESRTHLGNTPMVSQKPLTFEELDQYSGFVLYETNLSKFSLDPSVLKIPVLHDRAHIFMNDVGPSNQKIKFVDKATIS